MVETDRKLQVRDGRDRQEAVGEIAETDWKLHGGGDRDRQEAAGERY